MVEAVQTYNDGNKSWVKRSTITGKILDNSPDPFPDVPREQKDVDDSGDPAELLPEVRNIEAEEPEDERTDKESDTEESYSFFEWD